MYRSLLVPLDGSAHSARALPLASALAKRMGATVHVVTVNDPSAYIPFIPGEVGIPVYNQELVAARRAQDQETLNAAVATLQSAGVPVRESLLEGTVVEALQEYVEAEGMELVVMTTHGRSGFTRLRLGSVATAYLTRSTTPVLLVRSGSEEEGDAPPLELPRGEILCPLDGSPFAESMLPHLRLFADALGLRLHLLAISVPHALPMAPFGAETLLADDSALRAEEAGRLEYLQRMQAQCPPGTVVTAVTDLSVAHAILDASQNPAVGAIGMATHGRGGFKRFMLGSVADEVIRHARVPLLVYRPPA
jgi:nucleotide-binding universal stress UspA family protein